MKLVLQLWFLGAALCFFACKKESFSNDPTLRLRTSVDTLHFDTVFTTTGSTSQYIKIINNNSKGVQVNSVRLAGGATSYFRINVDGLPGPQANNIDIAANDSAYIYVTVTINPNTDSLPFIVRDSIEIGYNGNKKWVQLEAFGQNAIFIRNGNIMNNATWNNTLPYVILGQFTVRPSATLTINKGCRIHMHADAPFVVQGSLIVNGEKDSASRVVFTGDRLDDPYKGFPASFPGLIFTETSQGNRIRYAIIKNAYQGIVAAGLSGAAPKITLDQTIIENAYEQGIWALNTSIQAKNVLVSNCGQNVLLFGGGDYNFTHCTVAAYSTAYIPHKKRVLTVTDYYSQGNVVTTFPLSASFTNCIFWGEQNGFVDDEVLVEKKGSQTQTVTFDRVLWRIKNSLSASIVKVLGTPINSDPRFDSVNTSRRIFDFHLQKKGSPAVDAGINANVFLDLDGNIRPRGLAPDLGVYEKQ